MEVINNLSMDASRKQIRLLHEVTKTTSACMLDVNYLRLIHENVLSNAIKFSSYGSQVEIKFYEADGKSITEISDGGPGFTKEELPRLFMKFQKFSARPTGNEELMDWDFRS
jgi:signal transduction histidine kinase